ncbi:bifunctional diguanylate cyclase/phosphodiesterase [Tropicimonas sp. IMCC6043]|uniref:putative bifunctional diguanylate cyclase/phosphodiesterase n=1 Tax=Tropicimonas sp. IMCC6043 TaxID=2510645 RepID=UPI00101CEDDB|nr:bifunctional diguanylate cyclase/phosphodiesterase [Tropicimonas sp. IMCC6043]RYH08972.1 bifunctional diguanylate cyclase/phosphodiesterase [Tropicimonas sp. IMCC6043]
MARTAIRIHRIRRRLNHAFLRPQTLAFLPALMLGGFWFGGEGLLMITAVTFPGVLLLGGLLEGDRNKERMDGLTGLANREHLLETLAGHLHHFEGRGQSTIALVVQLDEFAEVAETLGTIGAEDVLRLSADRILGAIRPGDLAGRMVEHRYAVVLGPIRQANMEVGLRVSERIQAAIAEPISLEGGAVYVTASVGFCLARRAPRHTAESILEAAEIAMDEARRAGPGSIRSYSAEMGDAVEARQSLSEEIVVAFENGQIRAWFQPQISTDTGLVTGFEALARWDHPTRGVLPPCDFMAAVEASGTLERLGEVMLFQSLSALRLWDKSGYRVPRIGLNFSAAELRNPRLADRIRWELDRFDLTPDRLTIEVRQTVVAGSSSDIVSANITALAGLGCDVDLDDFGIGNASIANIRRFAVNRIKIDQSFVTRVDTDRTQQKMVAAILAMAEQLDLATLAEGIETHGEHAMLAQLGCGSVQGFGIAAPMPFEDTMAWMDKHMSRVGQAPEIGRPPG